MTQMHALASRGRPLDWQAAIWAGIAAGIVFMLLEMLLVQLFGPMSMWAPPRMIAAILMGQEVLPPPDTFDVTVLMVAMLIHFPLAVVLAFVLAWLVSRWELGLMAAIIVGTAFGLLIYLVNFYGLTVLFPWFADARGWISIFAHAMFGLVLGPFINCCQCGRTGGFDPRVRPGLPFPPAFIVRSLFVSHRRDRRFVLGNSSSRTFDWLPSESSPRLGRQDTMRRQRDES